MATTFNWIYLGTSSTQIDPTEGNATAENVGTLVGRTFGTAGDPLFNHITSATVNDTSGAVGQLDANNASTSDSFTTNVGADKATYAFDTVVIVDATITYANGSTTTSPLKIVQDATGKLFLAPDLAAGAMTTALEAMPIRSITITAANDSVAYGLTTDRFFTGFDDGYIEGTAGGDLINAAYVEPVANGTDKVDNADAGLSGASGNDDHIRAGAGNDTIYSGLGNDIVFAGDGNDLVYGGAGNDSLYGGSENDTLAGGAGSDVLDGGSGTDLADYAASGSGVTVNLTTGTASGGDAAGDTLTGIENLSGSGFADTLTGDGGANVLSGSAGADVLDGGGGNDSLYGGSGSDTLAGGAGSDVLDGGADADLILGGSGDTADGGEAVASGTDHDILDLTSQGPLRVHYDPMNPENGTVDFLDANRQVVGTMSFSNIESVVPCFTPDALIQTLSGPVAMGNLRLGDRVLTRDDGWQTIRWIGQRHFSADQLALQPHLQPIRIRADALGSGVPARDLLLSPQHRVLLASARCELQFGEQEVLAVAQHLCHLPGVARAAPQPVRYMHLLFDRHQIILSDGCWSESFHPGGGTMEGLPTGQRAELLSIFPELATEAGLAGYPSARRALRWRETLTVAAAAAPGGKG